MEHLCHAIGLPESVTREILQLHRDPAFHPNTEAICREESWEEGLNSLRRELGEDPRGIRMLCAQLRCALDAKKTYEILGLSGEIYADTMAAFSRFVEEHMESYGSYAFDRAFWTVRQISCKLFRIGQLEYELIHQNGKPVLSLHIPSDVRMEQPLLRASYERAREILGKTFPEYENAPVYCESWLLSPELAQLLPEHSRILRFRRSFGPIRQLEDSGEDVLQWVFKNPHLPLDQMPRNTSLQKALWQFLHDGGVFHTGESWLVEEPFLD